MPDAPRRDELLEHRLQRFTRMLHRVEKGKLDAVHPARVMSRRLRELLPLLRLDASTARKLGSRLRKISRRLGKLRELDVLLRLVEEIEASDRQARSALVRVRNDIRRTRDRQHASVLRRKVTADFRRLRHKLEEAAESVKDTRDSPVRARELQWAARARVARRAATLKRAVEEAGAVYLAERLHAVRISLKKLRYGAELAAEATGAPRTDDLRALEKTQDLLGRLHDTQTLVDRVRYLQASLNPPDVRAWQDLDALVVTLERRCRRLHARYVRTRPALAALCDRFGTQASASEAGIVKRKAS